MVTDQAERPACFLSQRMTAEEARRASKRPGYTVVRCPHCSGWHMKSARSRSRAK